MLLGRLFSNSDMSRPQYDAVFLSFFLSGFLFLLSVWLPASSSSHSPRTNDRYLAYKALFDALGLTFDMWDAEREQGVSYVVSLPHD